MMAQSGLADNPALAMIQEHRQRMQQKKDGGPQLPPQQLRTQLPPQAWRAAPAARRTATELLELLQRSPLGSSSPPPHPDHRPPPPPPLPSLAAVGPPPASSAAASIEGRGGGQYANTRKSSQGQAAASSSSTPLWEPKRPARGHPKQQRRGRGSIVCARRRPHSHPR